MRRAVWLLGLLLVASCGGPTSAPAPAISAVSAADLTAVATQTREDAVTPGLFRILLTNNAARPLTVTSVALDSPGFAPARPFVRDDPFPPAVTYALPARHGAARCATAALPATAVVTAAFADGPTTTLRLPLDSSDGLLVRLHESGCEAAALDRQVQLQVEGLHSAGPRQLRASLRVSRGSATGPVELREVRDSVVFDLSHGLPTTLEPTARTLDVPLTITMASCSGHVIGETKQPYLFPSFVTVDGRTAEVDLPTTAAQQAQLQQLVRTGCAGRRS